MTSVFATQKGDVNLDGKISSVDYLMLKRHFANRYTLNETQFEAADMSEDGRLTSIDYIMLRLIFRTSATPVPTPESGGTPIGEGDVIIE